MKLSFICFLLFFSLGYGCSDDKKAYPDKGVPDVGMDTISKDGQKPLPDAHLDGKPDSKPDSKPDTLPTDMGPPIENSFGFTIRVPQDRTIPCTPVEPMFIDHLDQKDMDWICAFDHGGTKGYVYIQSTVVECVTIMSATGIFAVTGAYFSSQGVVTSLQNAGYDWGGNHHNDSLSFDYNGQSYRYYHSSFSYGWRACQPMDCLQVYQSSGGVIVEDGCTSDRTLPAVCLEVEAGKTYSEADFVDNFAKCIGDPTR